MSVTPIAEAKPASLLRETEAEPGFRGLDRIGNRMALSIAETLIGYGATGAEVGRAPLRFVPFGAWRDEQPIGLGFARVRLAPLKTAMLFSMPGQLISHLVDLFFGGSGVVPAARTAFSPAETRFCERLAAALMAAIEQSWGAVMAAEADLIDIETNPALLSLVPLDDIVVIQPFALTTAALPPLAIECVYPLAALRPIAALSTLTESDPDPVPDPVWQMRMHEAVMNVRLPVRSIFARPELPLSRLMTLAPGDVIPITLPSRLPVTVAGRVFAHAIVGESDGRAAIKIQSIEQDQSILQGARGHDIGG